MNDDQFDSLNASTYWRDRNEKESKEKRQQSKVMIREIMKWWGERELWDQFAQSYPTRFAILLHNASAKGSVTYNPESNLFSFGEGLEFGVQVPNLPEWVIKAKLEQAETIFN